MCKGFTSKSVCNKSASIPVHDLDSIPDFPVCPCQFNPPSSRPKSIPHPACGHPLPSDGRGTRGGVVCRLSEKPATEFAGHPADDTETNKSCPFSLGEKVRMRADVKQTFPSHLHFLNSRHGRHRTRPPASQKRNVGGKTRLALAA